MKFGTWLLSLTIVCVFAVLVPIKGAFAHSFNYIAVTTTLEVQGSQINISTQVEFDFRPTQASRAALAEATAKFKKHFPISVAGQACTTAITQWTFDAESFTTKWTGQVNCPTAITFENLEITDTLFNDQFVAYDHYLTITAAGETREVVLTRDRNTYPGVPETTATPSAQAPESFWTVVQRFIGLGLKHILLGYDHILFLLTVILVVRKIRHMVLLVTAFTLAHSMTLILAGLQIVTLSARLVEPLIALSIALMAGWNIMLTRGGKKQVLRERWALTFGFGLLHGLGFAGALQDVGLPQTYFVPALVTFNVGVEIGQLLILGLLVPVLLHLRKHQPHWDRRTIIGTSAIIALLALYWTIRRVL
ncbi:MAG: HupE/UreJ family protein [Patescibacteria group bacterium]